MLKTKPNEIEILNHPQEPCEAPETTEGLRRVTTTGSAAGGVSRRPAYRPSFINQI